MSRSTSDTSSYHGARLAYTWAGGVGLNVLDGLDGLHNRPIGGEQCARLRRLDDATAGRDDGRTRLGAQLLLEQLHLALAEDGPAVLLDRLHDGAVLGDIERV
eukprot:scaffold1441_cov120-Isochrysis_galbana.AAC.16